MKTFPIICSAVFAGIALTLSTAEARPYGVSSVSYGRSTTYHTSRGGSAYVGPRGYAAQGSYGRTTVSTSRVSAHSGPNGAAYVARPPAAVVPLPGNYIRTIPAGSRTVVYGGTSCYYVGGVYYRPVFYGGTTVYVVVP